MTTATTTTRDEREVALDCLSKLAPWRAEDRECWYKCAAALKSVSDDLYAAFERWSQPAPNFNPRACATTWRSAPTDRVTLGTLIAWARQDGAEIDTGRADQRLRDLREAKADTPASLPDVEQDFPAIVDESRLAPDRLQLLAADLGVTAASLSRLSVGWLDRDRLGGPDGDLPGSLMTPCYGPACWAFPRVTACGRFGAIRLRTSNGKKFDLRGSEPGADVFAPSGVAGGDGTLFVIEGPTDTAAVLDMGQDCVGRPSNNAGDASVANWIALQRPQTREVVVVLDRDQADDDTAWRMLGRVLADGLEPDDARQLFADAGLTAAECGTLAGALKLTGRLRRQGRTVTLAMPPLGHKDARAWRRDMGADNDDLWGVVDTGYRLPGRALAWMSGRRAAS